MDKIGENMKSINDFEVSDTVWLLNEGRICCCKIISIEKNIESTIIIRLVDIDIFAEINTSKLNTSKYYRFSKLREKSFVTSSVDLLFRTKEELAKFFHDSILDKGTKFIF